MEVLLRSARREVVLRLGPVDLTAAPPGATHDAMHRAADPTSSLIRFRWPVPGWVHGYRAELRDGLGRQLPQQLIHHIELLNLERRNLMHPIFERTLGVGQETEEVLLPKSVGVRLEAGWEMALMSAFTNETGSDLRGVTLDLVIRFLPATQAPQPLDIRPLMLDVGFAVGTPGAFDLDPGCTTHAREWVFPIDARLLVVGGHLHDHARSLALVDAVTGKTLLSLAPRTAADGKLVGVSRKVFGVVGDGLRLRAGRRYRVVAVYCNPMRHAISDGGMAVIAGVIAPDAVAAWPKLDRTDPEYLADVAALERMARASGPPRSDSLNLPPAG
jgi:hypothetical protein